MRRYIEFKGFNGVSIMAYARVLTIDTDAIRDSMEENEEVLFLEEQHYYVEMMPVLFFGHGASIYNYKDMTAESEIVIAEETSRNYGFLIRDGVLWVTANGHIAPYTILQGRYSYCHNYKRRFRKFINSGVEFECYRQCDADVFASLFDGDIPVPYYDGSLDGGAEFKMLLSTFIMVLEKRILKSELKVDSTHIHISSKPVLYNTLLKKHELNDLLCSMEPKDVIKTFGRNYNRYCLAGTSIYNSDRYYAITVPDYDRRTDDNGNPKFAIYSNRVTVEFRAPRIKNIQQLKRFLKFIAKEIVGLENVDNLSHKQLIKLIADAPYGKIYLA